MKAVSYSQFGGPEVLQVVDLPDPHAGPGQIRVAVHAAGVNSTDTKARRGTMGGEPPMTTGREVAGIVDEVGDGVPEVSIGDSVFGFSDDPDGAGAAELALLTFFAPIPPTLGFTEAAALPVVVETATRGLDALSLSAGDTLLINGASGGIGSAAVQLAAVRGARVIGTASAANQDYLRSLGAEPVVYGDGLAERVRSLAPTGVDLALDVAGNGILPDLVDLTGSPGRVVTLADFEGSKRFGVKFSTGEDGRAVHAISDVGELIESGRFSLPIARTFPLAEIAEAHRISEDGHVRGKLVLRIR
jgi:NADPH:quinone reductase-like Zn-dependent oxidoreductase